MKDSIATPVRSPLISFLLLLLLFVAFSSQNSFHVVALQNHTDRLALLAVKAAITDDPHGSLKSWNVSLPTCQWAGVDCNNISLVQGLALDSMSLRGTISPSIANLTSLQYLYLYNNSFGGRIPSIFGSLPTLFVLDLGNNNFKASRASSDWAFLSSLANCSQLGLLALDDNDLGGELPVFITNLSTQLLYLSVGLNPRLGGAIPRDINNLVNLQFLEFQQCNFTGIIPDSIGQLPNLRYLFLSGNKLSGTVPSSIGNITQLLELLVDGNELQGEVPVSLGECQNLTVLNLSSNKLSGQITSGFLSLAALSSLNLSSNQLSGQIPSEFLGLATLSLLDLSNNQLSGQIPSEFFSLPPLSFVDLSSNQLSGQISSEFCSLASSPQHLNLSHNYLSGPLPSAVGNLHSLVTMDFSNNSLSGEIPGSVGDCQLLEILDLSHNNLSGSLPSILEDLPYLQLLNLAFNDLVGEVPTKGVFGNASAVGVVENAQLCGGIAELHLPSCSIQQHHGSHSLVVKVVVLAVCGIVLLCLSISCFLVRNSRKRPSMSAPLESSCRKISYMELMEATDNFSPYNLIGVGAFGSVFKGSLNDGETIAVKVLDLQQQAALKSFMAECEILSKIRHRNLVKILTVCIRVESNGDEFRALVFEFMENGSLDDWLHPKKDARISTRSLSLEERLGIAIDVAAALTYLHNDYEIPIAHCDLKPSNVLLDDNMNARVGDFGLARFLQSGSGQASRGTSGSLAVMGTIGYVPPEYGTGGQISTQGDVYSYGIMLLELITGRRPTDNMFEDGYNLPMFIEKELSAGTHVTVVVDPSLFSDVERGNNHENGMEKCLVSVLEVGLSCSKERPRDRMKMKDVVTRLLAIRVFLRSMI